MDTIEDVLEGFIDWETEEYDHWMTLIKDGVRTAYVNGISAVQAYFRTLLASMSYSNLDRFSFTKHCGEDVYDNSTMARE